MAAAEEGDSPTTHNDGSVSDEEEDPWKKDSTYLTMGNMKTKRAQSSAVWNCVRMLSIDHPKHAEGFTHVCTEDNCGTFFTLVTPKGKSHFGTTKLISHSKKCHPTGSGTAYLMDDEKRQVRGD
jgi:hypothetical protein